MAKSRTPAEIARRREQAKYLPIIAAGLQARGYRTELLDHGQVLAFVDGSDEHPQVIEAVRLLPYLDNSYWADCPLVWRWHVNHYRGTALPVAAYKRLTAETAPYSRMSLGESYPSVSCGHTTHLELSCLPGELGSLAAWLPSWLVWNKRRGVQDPAPVALQSPRSWDRRQGAPDVLDTPGVILGCYSWTLAAWVVADRWNALVAERRRVRLERRELARRAA